MRHLTSTVIFLTLSLADCLDYSSQPVTAPNEGLLPPSRNAPEIFRRLRRSVKGPSDALEPPSFESPVNFLGNETNAVSGVNSQPLHYLTPPGTQESNYADLATVNTFEDGKQPLAPPTQQEAQIFRVNISQTDPVIYSTNDNSSSEAASTAENKASGNSTDDTGDRSKRFIFPGISFDYGGGCCDSCGACDYDDGFRRRFRPRFLRRGRGPRRRGRGRRFGRRFLPAYDDYDYDYGGGGCGVCGRK